MRNRWRSAWPLPSKGAQYAKHRPPPLNKLANRLLARSCLAAIAAFPLFGTSVVSGQTDVGTTVVAEYLNHVDQFVGRSDAVHPPVAESGGTPSRGELSEPTQPITGLRGFRSSGHDCIQGCQTAFTSDGVGWHRTIGPTGRFFISFEFGHGPHEWWLAGDCLAMHPLCVHLPGRSGILPVTSQELTRRISDAVIAEDVAALLRYTDLPAVDRFAERSAIQVRSCDGESIVAHIPVDPELLAVVEMAASESESDR